MAASPDAPRRAGGQAGRSEPRRPVLQLAGLRGFVHLLAVRWPAQTADGMLQLAAAGLLLFATVDPRQATSALELAQLIALTALPFTVAGPLAGVLLDRWRRQRILVWTNALRIVVIAASLPLVSRFALGLSWGQAVFYGALLVAISLNRFFLAAVGAVVPRVVPGRELVTANAVASTGGSVAALAGVGVGGALAAAIGDTSGGPEVVVLVALGLYGASAVAAAAMPTGALGPDRSSPPPPLAADLRQAAGELVEGARLLAATRRAWAPIVGFSLLRAAQLVATVAALLVLRNAHGAGSGTLALFFTVFGGGVLAGAVGIAAADRLRELGPAAGLRAGLAATGLGVLTLAPGLDPGRLLALAGVMGVGFGTGKITTDTLVQGALPDRVRGRTFTAYDVAVNLAVVAGGVVAAAVLGDARTTPPLVTPLLVVDGLVAVVAVLTSGAWLGDLPPPVDVATWEQAEQVLSE